MWLVIIHTLILPRWLYNNKIEALPGRVFEDLGNLTYLYDFLTFYFGKNIKARDLQTFAWKSNHIHRSRRLRRANVFVIHVRHTCGGLCLVLIPHFSGIFQTI